MILNDVHTGITKNKKRKRVGRGIGSGHGRTCGRGEKGHSSRAGFSYPFAFEGGQKPLMRKVAKRGFNNNYFATQVAIVNLSTLDERFEAGETVTPESLAERGLVKGTYEEIKILAKGELTKKLSVKAHRFSGSARERIEAAGGQVEVLLK